MPGLAALGFLVVSGSISEVSSNVLGLYDQDIPGLGRRGSKGLLRAV